MYLKRSVSFHTRNLYILLTEMFTDSNSIATKRFAASLILCPVQTIAYIINKYSAESR